MSIWRHVLRDVKTQAIRHYTILDYLGIGHDVMSVLVFSG